MYQSELLERAMMEMASRCDGAGSEDGLGFNKLDANFGKSLALKPNWSIKQTRAAWRMLAKYKGQLSNYGVNYDDIPEPPIDEEAKPAVNRRMCRHTTENVILLAFEYDPEIVEAVKELPRFARKYDRDTRVWTITPSVEVSEPLLAFAKQYGFEVESGVHDLLAEVTEKRQDLLIGSRAEDSDLIIQGLEGLGGTLRPFQKAGVAYAVATERTFIADQMGLGKTIEALATVWAKKAFPAIIVCPASVKYNWALEALKWLPGLRVGMVKGKDFYQCIKIGENRIYAEKDRHGLPGAYDIIVINYDLVKPKPNKWRCYKAFTNPKQIRYEVGDAILEPISGYKRDDKEFVKQHFKRDGLGDSKNGLLEKFLKIDAKALIPDESHLLKSYKSQRSKGVKQLSKNIPVILMLSGTPMLSRPSELISQLSILRRLDDMGGFKYFTEYYCGAFQGRFGPDMSGAQNLQELNTNLRSIGYIRRTKKQVLTELPDEESTNIIIELDNRKIYNDARNDLVKWLKENAKLEEDFLDEIKGEPQMTQDALIASYRQTAAMRAARALQLTKIEHLKQLAAQGKLEMAKKWIENFLESGEKLVVFATHIDIQDALLEKFAGSAHILGSDSDSEREDNKQRFQNDDDCKLIVCSLKAASMGITLTAASDVAFLELGWTPADHDQCTSRCHRMGQKDNVMAWYLLAKDSIDEDITELINEKRIVVDAATDGGGDMPEQSSIMNDLIGRLTK